MYQTMSVQVNKVLDGKQMIEKGFNSTNRVINNVMDPTRWAPLFLYSLSILSVTGEVEIS